MLNVIMLSVIYAVSFMLSVIYAERHKQAIYAECRYAECRYAECRSAVKAATFKNLI